MISESITEWVEIRNEGKQILVHANRGAGANSLTRKRIVWPEPSLLRS